MADSTDEINLKGRFYRNCIKMRNLSWKVGNFYSIEFQVRNEWTRNEDLCLIIYLYLIIYLVWGIKGGRAS